MSSTSKAPSIEVGNVIHLARGDEEENKDEGEDEEEDVDFNPFLKDPTALEASSSLSSEVEILDVDVADSNGRTGVASATNLSSMLCGEVQDYVVGDSEHGKEIVMLTATSSRGVGAKESERASPSQFKKRKAVLISHPENMKFHGKENGSSSETDCVNDVMVGDVTQCGKPIVDIDDEDAICKRTRARYSLTSFTLDELETFLQETDDEDDLQNVDDEEEYRKFLAAVLHGGDGDSQIRQANENVDDEDEENDADFEIEIEEALESDIDNTRGEKDQKGEAAGRRPETRQNRRQKASVRQKKRILGQPSRPLRPLLPNAPLSSFPVLIPETAPQFLSSSGHDGFINGFTPHQLGQLHCLIHEHVQLLIQVFSLCILEPSRQHIASQTGELISEMLHKRDQVVSWRRMPYPWFCFCPPYIHPSVRHGHSRSLTRPSTSDSACSFDEQRADGTRHGPCLDIISPSKERSGCASNGQDGCFQASDSALWVPFVNGPILSVIDVAPLKLVGKYMEDVSIAVREYQRRYVEDASNTRFKKEPLFPFHCSQSFVEANTKILRETTLATARVPSYSAVDQPPKKTLAAALVERTKKEPVALVSKEIANLAHRFLPLFNPVLFPHKPPPAPVANRVLFTDAEDELLALGLMEYNTDWKAIQQRFLPCKSKHQIFVRQKNRSSSKAPENPIKAVRRMKSSPLTVEEKARIQEGLKVFKLDWMSVWKFVVPYRDPSLLPRQWRIATGTQKSYKSTADKKEKRRLYASNRRKCKVAALPTWQTSSEKDDCQTDKAGGENNSGDDYIENEDEVYVHEAFLSDWRPVSMPGERNQRCDLLLQGGSNVSDQRHNIGSRESLLRMGLQFSASSHFTHSRSDTPAVEPNHPVSDLNLRPSKYQYCSRPFRSRKTNSNHLVKLAPDLPPINLPPSVRVMSQSAFKSYQCGAAGKMVSPLPHVANSGSSNPIKPAENRRNPLQNSNANQHRRKSFVLGDKSMAEDNGESDLHMHPLLFQSLGNAHLPYYPSNSVDGTPSTFNRFSSFQTQLNLSLLHNSHQANQAANFSDKSSKSKETASSAGVIDFHPLLQKAGDVSCVHEMAHSVAKLSVNSKPLRDSCCKLQDLIDPETREANDLDLDINLSFSSGKKKAEGRRDVAENNPETSNFSDLGSRTSKRLDSGGRELFVSGSTRSIYRVDNVGDLSLPEIVMEREELSDSEEEIGEHVEFECEEMDDSEGDEGRRD